MRKPHYGWRLGHDQRGLCHGGGNTRWEAAGGLHSARSQWINHRGHGGDERIGARALVSIRRVPLTVGLGTGLANSGTFQFTPPGNNSAGASDWVLVLDVPDNTKPTLRIAAPTTNPALTNTTGQINLAGRPATIRRWPKLRGAMIAAVAGQRREPVLGVCQASILPRA